MSNCVPVFLHDPKAILYCLQRNCFVYHIDMQLTEEEPDTFSTIHHGTVWENTKENLIFSYNYTGKVDKHLVLHNRILNAELAWG